MGLRDCPPPDPPADPCPACPPPAPAPPPADVIVEKTELDPELPGESNGDDGLAGAPPPTVIG